MVEQGEDLVVAATRCGETTGRGERVREGEEEWG